jgi:hypothetical protein
MRLKFQTPFRSAAERSDVRLRRRKRRFIGGTFVVQTKCIADWFGNVGN